jgi:hypothetical protein
MRSTLRKNSPPTMSWRARSRACTAIALGAALIVPAASGAVAAEDDQVTVTVEGVLERVIVESDDAGSQGLGGDEVVSLVEVDGNVYALPSDVPVDGATGDIVDITVTSATGLSVAEVMSQVGEQAVEQTPAAEAAAAEAPAEAAPAEQPTETAEVLSVVTTGTTGAETPVTGTGGDVLAATIGHTLTVLPVYWGSADAATPSSLTAAAQAAGQYWNTQSAGRIAVQASVRPWVKIADPVSCNTGTLFNAALAANGSPPVSATQHVLVYFPYRSDCGWAGQASVGSGRIWVNGTQLVDVFAHELGHNLGLGHAQTMTCAQNGVYVPLAVPVTSYCSQQPYGDWADVMGIGTNMATGNLNSAFADYLGFASVTAVSNPPSSPTTARINPLGAFSGTRAMKLNTGEGTLYLDYRPSVAPDVRKPGWGGVQAHLRRLENGVPYTYLLDLQASTAASFSAANLPVSRLWSVPGTATQFTVTATDSAATVTATAAGMTVDDGVDRYITKVYLDLFGRGVDPTGLAGWGAALRSGTPRIAVANSITYSDEYRAGLIAGSYRTYLGRNPDPAGASGWLGAMRGGATIQQMEAGFLASSEYYSQAGGTDAAWIDRLYRHVLGRAPAPAEVQGWVGVIAAGGRSSVSMSFLLSSEHLGTVIDGYYHELLGRGIDPAGRAAWVAAVQQGARIEQIIGGIIASSEYYNIR